VPAMPPVFVVARWLFWRTMHAEAGAVMLFAAAVLLLAELLGVVAVRNRCVQAGVWQCCRCRTEAVQDCRSSSSLALC
jgi:hypothetical protein